jgi:isochorismate synthase
MIERTVAGLVGALEGLFGTALRHDGRTLISVTVEAPRDLDPVAAVFASRLAADRWFCWEQPDRGFALAALGSAHEEVSRGPGRFADLVGACAALARGRLAEEPAELPAGAGPVWVGGFAFAPDGGGVPEWASFPPALAVLPELAIVRDADRVLATACIVAGSGGDRDAPLRRLSSRLQSLGAGRALPLLDPHPTGEVRVRSATAPSSYEEGVARATERIRSGELKKVVLAREVVVEAPAAHEPAALFGALRELFPSCFCFCCGTPEAAFVGASPELLVRRSGAGASTVALAGSTRRSADPAVDDHLGEQLVRSEKDRSEHDIVVRRIERTLGSRAVWVEAAPEPGLVQVANIQHLATPIHAQLADPLSAIELAGMLHPTPAVGGEPREAALAAIAELESFDRGWYAGPVGWMDATEDGEFCVGLRSALLRDRFAHLYAGNGIVAGSEPSAELAETEVKLDALLPLLVG